jgi:hypothetical protein
VCDRECAARVLEGGAWTEADGSEGDSFVDLTSHAATIIHQDRTRSTDITYATVDIGEFDPGDDPYIECGACQTVLLAGLPDGYTDEAFDAYVECALWSSLTDDDTPMDKDHDPDDIDADSLADMRGDVDAFMDDNAADLVGHWDAGQAGHDFWLTRNGHGAGFWDRGKGARGDRLSAAARVYGTSNLYVADDGKVYVS